MPTIGYRPTLETTQAVGALLLHQFARDQFLHAGVNEDLIREAECREHVDELVSQTLLTDGDYCSHDMTTQFDTEPACQHPNYSSSMNESNISDEKFNASNAATRNSSVLSSTLSETLLSDPQEQTYHSLQEHSLNGTTATSGHDKTLYHSVANSSANNGPGVSTSTFDRLRSSPNVTLYGDELRRIAMEFERSSLREMVRNRANQVNLADITKESFTRLLKELFQEKITREKIVILFFFCTDVALRAVSFAQELVIKLLGWSFSYIINIVCKFVHNLGGWDKVLFYQLPSLMITCCAGLAICALLVFLKNSLRS